MSKIGVVGIGTMGKCILDKLIENGYDVVATDKSSYAKEYIKNKGATLLETPFEIAQETKIIIMSLPTPQVVLTVVGGEDGLCGALTEEHIVVDTSTVAPETSKQAKEMVETKGAQYVDAPILGRPAAVGNWLMPAGGNGDAIEKVTPILRTVAKAVVNVGETGSGNALKLLNQLMFSTINAISSEVMVLAEKVGIDKKTFYESVANSGAATVNGLFCEVGKRIVDDRYQDPTFTVALLCKDAQLGIDMAKSNGITPLIAEYVQMYNLNAKRRHGDEDTSALAKLFKEIYEH
ncbi:NAD(P)-dependent oxidoreductase [Petroclostridium sp. X23]|uniref:NAD(P)-dependent oxidoreductase n=1 Tax=Petroclostridium sp. X23 TaxID=3045146 RepID=UPI0024ACB8B3|nr:NAD(P)-dependent oxidoreductase [Petroclostridium sp. X23]WHH60936.1 NAD(P)-dependent oxidoreductase [Petroclostridium sp. X23]